MKEAKVNTANRKRSGRQFEIEDGAESSQKVRAGKDFKPNQTEEQDSTPQSIVMGERLPNLIDYSYLKLESMPIRGLKLLGCSAGLLILSLIIWDVYDTIAAAMSFHWLAAFGLLVLALLVVVLGLITFYKYRKDRRKQNAYKTIRKLAERCTSASLNAAEERLIEELKLFYVGKPQKMMLDQCLSSLPDYALGHEVITHINDVFLKPLDTEALNRVSRFSYQTGLTVALSPWVAVDMVLSLWRSIKMIDEIGQVYGIRPSMLNRLSMLKSIVGHLALTGAGELAADHILDEVGGASLASIFSVRLSQGLGVGLYLAKIGLATIAVSRPMEFIENKPELKSLAKVLIEQFKSQFKLKK
jgi:putative membrane protein